MHGCRADLLGFVLPLKGSDQFPSLLGLLIDRVFHVRRPGTLIRVQVDDFVAQSRGHETLLSLDLHAMEGGPYLYLL